MAEAGDITVNAQDSLNWLASFGERIEAAAMRGFVRAGRDVLKHAKRNAPRSPTKAQIIKTLKRKKTTDRNPTPGGLEKSITVFVDTHSVSVGIPSGKNVDAYAVRIHDEKYIKWLHRGPGTVAKGERADEKFIARAVEDRQAATNTVVDEEINKELAKDETNGQQTNLPQQ